MGITQVATPGAQEVGVFDVPPLPGVFGVTLMLV
jgi:hypothetical protein